MSQVAKSTYGPIAFMTDLSAFQEELDAIIELRIQLTETHTKTPQFDLFATSYRVQGGARGVQWHQARLFWPTSTHESLLGVMLRLLFALQNMHEADQALDRIGQ